MAQMIGVTEADVRKKLEQFMESGQLGEAITKANEAMASKAAEVGEEIRFDPAAQEGKPATLTPAEDAAIEGSAAGIRDWFRSTEGVAEAEGFELDDRTVPAPSRILTEADNIMNGDRANDYGENSLPRIAQYWSTYLGKDVTGRDVANLMILLKVAREGHAVKRDNHVDIAGYVALADQLDAA